MLLSKFSVGVGDRFGRESHAQLAAFVEAKRSGAELAVVWNKSFREHSITHTKPESVRAAAERAVAATGWTGPFHVDADHINLKSVDLFVDSCDFFTIDVAEFIGAEASPGEIEAFVSAHRSYLGELEIPALSEPVTVSEASLRAVAGRYLRAVQEAGRIYRRVAALKAPDAFIVEISMDETDVPQSPAELAFILSAAAREGIPLQTIAPRFSGRFNKGVDYVGDVGRFGRELSDDMAVISWAIREFGMTESLKLSVHSGSDKFSLYPVITSYSIHYTKLYDVFK